jgi:hypothetical protein
VARIACCATTSGVRRRSATVVVAQRAVRGSDGPLGYQFSLAPPVGGHSGSATGYRGVGWPLALPLGGQALLSPVILTGMLKTAPWQPFSELLIMRTESSRVKVLVSPAARSSVRPESTPLLPTGPVLKSPK